MCRYNLPAPASAAPSAPACLAAADCAAAIADQALRAHPLRRPASARPKAAAARRRRRPSARRAARCAARRRCVWLRRGGKLRCAGAWRRRALRVRFPALLLRHPPTKLRGAPAQNRASLHIACRRQRHGRFHRPTGAPETGLNGGCARWWPDGWRRACRKYPARECCQT